MSDYPESSVAGHVLIYDGLCTLCSGWVQFVLRNDKIKQFSFIAMQSERGRAIALDLRSKEVPDALILFADGRYYLGSDAAIEVLLRLGIRWKWALLFKLIPPLIRDFVYRIVARNRYRWFGKRETCMLLERPSQH